MDLTGLRTDKLGHGYAPAYLNLRNLLTFLFGPAINIAEIGIASGDGLQFFRRLFPNAFIVGVDKELTPDAINTGESLIRSEQDSPELRARMSGVVRRAGYHLIVDDASHDPKKTRETLINLWPLLVPGGVYVIEDWSHSTGLESLAFELIDGFVRNRPSGIPIPSYPMMVMDGLIVLGPPVKM